MHGDGNIAVTNVESVRIAKGIMRQYLSGKGNAGGYVHRGLSIKSKVKCRRQYDE